MPSALVFCGPEMLCCGMGDKRNRVSRQVQGYQRGRGASGISNVRQRGFGSRPAASMDPSDVHKIKSAQACYDAGYVWNPGWNACMPVERGMRTPPSRGYRFGAQPPQAAPQTAQMTGRARAGMARHTNVLHRG